MPPLTARDTAHRLIARERAAGGDASDGVAVAERALRRLCDDLVAWFGPIGAHALVTRALAHARADHPALAPVSLAASATPYLDGFAESGRAHGPEAAAAGAVDVLAGLVDLLSRMIGATLATTLVERSGQADGAGRRSPGSSGRGGGSDTGAGRGATDTNSDTTGSPTDD